jgi:hypothetical protein
MLTHSVNTVSGRIQEKNNYKLNIRLLEIVNKNICTITRAFIFLGFLTKVEFKLI